MYGDLVTLGEYYVELPVNGQIVNVQVDTGSSTLAVPLKQCLNCRPNDRRLDIDEASIKSSFVKCSSDACKPNTCHAYGQCSACSRKTRACCSLVSPELCGFYLQYADGSGAAGALVRANVTLAGITVPAYLGAILRVTEGFENSAVDGILGMAFSTLACNPTCVNPIFDEMVAAKKVERDVFSLCIGRHGGVLTLGGSNPDLYDGKLQYVPLASRGRRDFYDVRISAVRVGDKSVSVPDFTDGIVDSGTTVLVIAPKAYAALKYHFQSNYCSVPGLCPAPKKHHAERKVKIIRVTSEQSSSVWYQHELSQMTTNASEDLWYGLQQHQDQYQNRYQRSLDQGKTWFAPGYCASLSDEEVAMLPNITIVLAGGVELTIEPELYMLRYEQPSSFLWGNEVYRCLGITYLPGLDKMHNNVILGDTVCQAYYVEYDRENERLGFARSRNCASTSRKQLQWTPGQRDNGALGTRALSPAFLSALTLGSIIAWIAVIVRCTRDSRRNAKREQYTPIR